LEFGFWILGFVDSRGIVFGVAREGNLKNSLLIPEEFLDAKKLRTLPGANRNSPDKSGSNNDLLEGIIGRPRFLAKIPKVLHKLFFQILGY